MPAQAEVRAKLRTTAHDRQADVLSTIVQRLRNPNGNTPCGVLRRAGEALEPAHAPAVPARHRHRAPGVHPSAIGKLLINALAATGITDTNGNPLVFQPHDFRRIFVTDAFMNGLSPRIAQIICGHKTIDTTIGYKAVYPAETIEAHRAFIARRRATRPGEEYRNPTWDSFLAHFEKRKVSVGTCARFRNVLRP